MDKQFLRHRIFITLLDLKNQLEYIKSSKQSKDIQSDEELKYIVFLEKSIRTLELQLRTFA